jgi:hypothetical protein
MIQVRATAMSEAGDFPDDPTLVQRMMAFHDEMAKAGVLLDGAGLQPSSQGFRARLHRHHASVTKRQRRDHHCGRQSSRGFHLLDSSGRHRRHFPAAGQSLHRLWQ